jgi:hypothetical protein
LGNARSVDQVSDRALSASVAATQSVYIEDGGSFSWGGRMTGESYSRYTKLNNLALGANISYRKKLGLGPLAPWWRTAWSASALNYRDHGRNGWLHQAEFGAGRRLNEQLNLGINFFFEKRTASSREEEVPGLSGDAFSQLSKNVGVNAEYAPRRNLVLNLGAQLRHGDIVSTSHRYRQVFLHSKAIAEDNALGAGMYAYRLTGNTLSLNLCMALFLSPDSHFNFALRRMLTHADGDNNYAKNNLALSWVGSF